MKRLLAFAVTVLAFCVGACTNLSATYHPGAADLHQKNEAVIDRPYDEVWENLIDYAASAFFAIDSYEKASGLITLAFGSSDPSKFVNCGTIRIATGFPDHPRSFNGSYERYATEVLGDRLRGRMNIVVRKLGGDSTRVSVHALYNFGALSFTSSEPSTSVVTVEGKPLTVTCNPTLAAERAVLRALTGHATK